MVDVAVGAAKGMHDHMLMCIHVMELLWVLSLSSKHVAGGALALWKASCGAIKVSSE